MRDSIQNLRKDACKAPVVGKSSWANDVAKYLFSPNLSDLTIVVNKVHIHAHKFVLGLNSPVFLAMFESDMQEGKEKNIYITDFSEDTVRLFLRCLYGSLSVIEVSTHASDLYVIADKYDVQSLVKGAEKQLISNLDVQNCITTLLFGDSYANEMIKNAAIKFIVESAQEGILATKGIAARLGPDLCDEVFAHLNVQRAAANASDAAQEQILVKIMRRAERFNYHMAR